MGRHRPVLEIWAVSGSAGTRQVSSSVSAISAPLLLREHASPSALQARRSRPDQAALYPTLRALPRV